MSVAQFRQIGVPDTRKTNSEVRQLLKRAQRRTETVLNRPTLPHPHTLLTSIGVLRDTVQQAYDHLPLQRFTLLQQHLEDLQDNVERAAHFSWNLNGDITQALRHVYRTVSVLLQDLSPRKQPKLDDDTKNSLQKFLTTAAERGWRVQEQSTDSGTAIDGFGQSINYIFKMSVDPDNLLPASLDFGVTEASILLLNETPIPETVLLEWTKPPYNLDVYVVFGNYVVLSHCGFLGLRPHLALLSKEDDETGVDIKRFASVADYLDDQGTADARLLIQSPRRILHHYYCPMLNVQDNHRQYFRTWDLLTR